MNPVRAERSNYDRAMSRGGEDAQVAREALLELHDDHVILDADSAGYRGLRRLAAKRKSPGAKAWGARKWRELHLRALAFGDASSEPAWLGRWLASIPACCHRVARSWMQAHRPDLSSGDTYFAWTVEFHNAINEELDVPTMTVEQARELWMQHV